jgi:hypothetical protein
VFLALGLMDDMHPVQDWQLLCAVAPSFFELATFYTGKDEAAVAARAKIDLQEGGKESFYANLRTETESLVHYTETWDGSLGLPSSAIARVLKLLENRCSAVRRWDKVSKVHIHIQPQLKGLTRLFSNGRRAQQIMTGSGS